MFFFSQCLLKLSFRPAVIFALLTTGPILHPLAASAPENNNNQGQAVIRPSAGNTLDMAFDKSGNPATPAHESLSPSSRTHSSLTHSSTIRSAASLNQTLAHTATDCQAPEAPSMEAKPRATNSRRNVLFIMVDDLRPELGCFGKASMHTPHIDELASRGRLFERAYCMVPTCGASRASLMSGLRPHAKRFVSFTARADEDAPGITTLNQHFKDNGYRTISLGKVFHNPADSVAGWSKKPWRPTASNYRDSAAEKKAIAAHRQKYPKRDKVRGMPYESSGAEESEYGDHQIATRAIEHMEELQKGESPFFLAVGFFKPHLPFCAPQKYWDLYDFDSIAVPDNYRSPPAAPPGAIHQSGELRSYATIPPKGALSTYQARKLIHGYYACVSFIDHQVGRLIAAMDETGLSDNTVIILCGDHGWQLGDHGMWNKHSCFETSMHTPLIVVVPGKSEAANRITGISALTEFIDIYPSLCELTGLEKPNHLQGTSFVPLLNNPNLPGKPYAVGRFRSGDTIRTEQLRLSEFRGNNGSGKSLGSMLYDHRTDPEENLNLANRPEQQSTVQKLLRTLRKTIPKETD